MFTKKYYNLLLNYNCICRTCDSRNFGLNSVCSSQAGDGYARWATQVDR